MSSKPPAPSTTQHIDAFIDLVSPYSYFATSHLLSLRPLLHSHSITLTIHPVYLGAIQVTTGNIPPFKIPAKAQYSKFDVPRAAAHFGVRYMKTSTPSSPSSTPSWFPMASLQAQRVLTVVKEEAEQEDEYERVLLALFERVWVDGRNLGEREVLREVLAEVLGGGEEEEEGSRVMGRIGEEGIKKRLMEVTNWAVELGAFGMPFFSARNKQGKREPFFGSDRFEYLFEYLGLPLQRMRIKEKGEESGGGSKL